MNIIKIWYNTKLICFLPNYELLKSVQNGLSMVSLSKTSADIFLDFQKFLRQDDCLTLFYVSSPVGQQFQKFCSNLKCIDAAGGVVRDPDGRVLFIFRNGKWDLPKGKVEKGEEIRKAAIRECEEECGVRDLKIVRKLNPTYHMYILNEKLHLKTTHWFEMRIPQHQQVVPQMEEGITLVEWRSKRNWKEIYQNTYPGIYSILTSL